MENSRKIFHKKKISSNISEAKKHNPKQWKKGYKQIERGGILNPVKH